MNRNRLVYAENIPPNSTEANLLNYLEKFADVEEVYLLREKQCTKRSIAAFIRLASDEDVEKILLRNQQKFWGKRLFMVHADQARHFPADHSVIVRNITKQITEEILFDHFADCGVIEFLQIRTDDFAYLSFQDKPGARNAMAKNNMPLKNINLKIQLLTRNVEIMIIDLNTVQHKMPELYYKLCKPVQPRDKELTSEQSESQNQENIAQKEQGQPQKPQHQQQQSQKHQQPQQQQRQQQPFQQQRQQQAPQQQRQQQAPQQQRQQQAPQQQRQQQAPQQQRQQQPPQQQRQQQQPQQQRQQQPPQQQRQQQPYQQQRQQQSPQQQRQQQPPQQQRQQQQPQQQRQQQPSQQQRQQQPTQQQRQQQFQQQTPQKPELPQLAPKPQRGSGNQSALQILKEKANALAAEKQQQQQAESDVPTVVLDDDSDTEEKNNIPVTKSDIPVVPALYKSQPNDLLKPIKASQVPMLDTETKSAEDNCSVMVFNIPPEMSRLDFTMYMEQFGNIQKSTFGYSANCPLARWSKVQYMRQGGALRACEYLVHPLGKNQYLNVTAINRKIDPKPGQSFIVDYFGKYIVFEDVAKAFASVGDLVFIARCRNNNLKSRIYFLNPVDEAAALAVKSVKGTPITVERDEGPGVHNIPRAELKTWRETRDILTEDISARLELIEKLRQNNYENWFRDEIKDFVFRDDVVEVTIYNVHPNVSNDDVKAKLATAGEPVGYRRLQEPYDSAFRVIVSFTTLSKAMRAVILATKPLQIKNNNVFIFLSSTKPRLKSQTSAMVTLDKAITIQEMYDEMKNYDDVLFIEKDNATTFCVTFLHDKVWSKLLKANTVGKAKVRKIARWNPQSRPKPKGGDNPVIVIDDEDDEKKKTHQNQQQQKQQQQRPPHQQQQRPQQQQQQRPPQQQQQRPPQQQNQRHQNQSQRQQQNSNRQNAPNQQNMFQQNQHFQRNFNQRNQNRQEFQQQRINPWNDNDNFRNNSNNNFMQDNNFNQNRNFGRDDNFNNFNQDGNFGPDDFMPNNFNQGQNFGQNNFNQRGNFDQNNFMRGNQQYQDNNFFNNEGMQCERNFDNQPMDCDDPPLDRWGGQNRQQFQDNFNEFQSRFDPMDNDDDNFEIPPNIPEELVDEYIFRKQQAIERRLEQLDRELITSVKETLAKNFPDRSRQPQRRGKMINPNGDVQYVPNPAAHRQQKFFNPRDNRNRGPAAGNNRKRKPAGQGNKSGKTDHRTRDPFEGLDIVPIIKASDERSPSPTAKRSRDGDEAAGFNAADFNAAWN